MILKKQSSICEYMLSCNEKETLEGSTVIGEKAFYKLESLKELTCRKVWKICKQAFAFCDELNSVCCENKENESETEELQEIQISEGEGTKTLRINVEKNFQIQYQAFLNCENLETVILPKVSGGRLDIEKEAFKGCTSLRTVVALSKNAAFTENPFEDCPDYLTFICLENSDVEKFAREHGYRTINVNK